MTASPSGTVIAVDGQVLTDAGNIQWHVDNGNEGFQRLSTNNAFLLYLNNRVYRRTAQGVWGWWQGAWVTTASPLAESSDDTAVTDTTLVVDNTETLWNLAGGQVAMNGKPDPTTSNAILLLYYGGQIYYENAARQWFVWTP